MQSSSRWFFVASVVLLLCSLLGRSQSTHPAQPNRFITIDVQHGGPLDQARVLLLNFDGRELPPWRDQQVSVEGDWGKSISFVVRNESQKTLVALMPDVQCHDRNTAKPGYAPKYGKIGGWGRLVGQIPGGVLRNSRGETQPEPPSPPISIAPGQQAEIPFPTRPEGVGGELERDGGIFPPGSITGCTFSVASAYFADGTRWSAGVFYRLDPLTPGSFKPTSFEDFSGGKSEADSRGQATTQWLRERQDSQSRFADNLLQDGPPELTSPVCRKVDTSTLAVTALNGTFAVHDSSGILFECGKDEVTVRRAFQVFEHYSIDQVCSIESNQTFEFLTSGGGAPSGELAGEDCIPMNPAEVVVSPGDGRWELLSGSILTSFKTKKAADAAAEQIRKYGFKSTCAIGRGTYGIPRQCVPMTYFRQ